MTLPIFQIALACLPLAAFAAEPLSAQRITEIIALKHEDRLDEDALKIYPKARAYELTITSTLANGQSHTSKTTATEKWVEGRYIVSEAQPAGPETRFAMIVEFDKDSKRFRNCH